MKLGIVTATYNRKKLLKRLYKSLNNQVDINFTWIIIDDGSTDETLSYIDDMSSSFEIRYFYKINSGKAKSLNYAFKNNKDIDLFIVVDSDDYLLENAISTIRSYALKYNDDQIGALFFKYQFKNGKILGEEKETYNNDIILSRIEHDSKFDKIDGCICYFNKTVKKYQYPEIKGEKYVGPTVIQLKMSDEFKIIFSNEVVGVAEYQENGLTDSGRKLRIKSPKSMMVYCHYMQDKSFNLSTRVKYGVMANAYYYIGNKYNRNVNEANLKRLRIPKKYKAMGIILGIFWMYKYKTT